MKTHILILTVAVALCVSLFPTVAADRHEHKAAPKGGRLLEKTEPHAEFVIERDRSVTIHFYNHDMKPVAATTQFVTVIADTKDGKATLTFAKKGNSLTSTAKLPDGHGYNLIVQFRQTAEAKPQNFRFTLDLRTCGGCKLAEYACTCGH